jgi:hypothetical protein
MSDVTTESNRDSYDLVRSCRHKVVARGVLLCHEELVYGRVLE